MAQDLVSKRRNLVTAAVIQAKVIVAAIQAFQELQAEYAQCGTFAQVDLDGTSNAHVTPGILAAVFGGNGVVDSMSEWYANNGTKGNAAPTPVNKQNILQLLG